MVWECEVFVLWYVFYIYWGFFGCVVVFEKELMFKKLFVDVEKFS